METALGLLRCRGMDVGGFDDLCSVTDDFAELLERQRVQPELQVAGGVDRLFDKIMNPAGLDVAHRQPGADTVDAVDRSPDAQRLAGDIQLELGGLAEAQFGSDEFALRSLPFIAN